MSVLPVIEKIIDEAVAAGKRAKRLIRAIPSTANEIEGLLAEKLVALDRVLSGYRAALQVLDDQNREAVESALAIFDKIAAAEVRGDEGLIRRARIGLLAEYAKEAFLEAEMATQSPEGTP